MRSMVLFSGVAAVWALAGCSNSTPGGSSHTGGSTASSGRDEGSGGSGRGSSGSNRASSDHAGGHGGGHGEGSEVPSSGGNKSGGGARGGTLPGEGWEDSSGGAGAGDGTSASGGAPGGGDTNPGGRVGSGGAPARGGSSASGGKTASGGAAGKGSVSGGEGGTEGTTAAYQGPCDVLANGCAEAYGMARAMTSKYTGPLFQLGLAKDKTKTLDIGQTADRKADMTTWSDFCGGTQSNCVVSKIYAQIHSGNNDLLPAVWKAPWGPDCSAGGYTCAAKFTIESATSLPILTTDAPQEYALSGDNFATGINGGKKAMGLMYNGKPVPNQVYCCGVFGLTHKYNANDTYGTDFMLALAYGWRDSNGCCIAVNCGASNKYCVGAEEEENNDLYDYGSSPLENAMVVTQFDPSQNAVITYLNGSQVLSHSPPKAELNAGTAIHVGGGGDLSQPDPVRMREAIITNNLMTSSEVTAMKANITGFFSTLKFP